MKEKEPITLSALYGGAVVEAVDHEISNVLANIMDVNTNATQTRTVTLKLKVKPGKERNIASVTFQASSTLAPAEALETSIIIDRDQHGKPAAFELLQKEPPLSVLPIYGVGGDQ